MSSNVPTATLDKHLKKIYDCLNIGSNKKAAQEADRLPKKIKDRTCVKALKSLALLRMGKNDAAQQLLDEIDIRTDLDDVTLQTMTTCYKESLQVHKIIDLYQAACDRHPQHGEIHANLFISYVRTGNYKKQKEVAMNMYKNFPAKKRICSFWAVMSLVMQASAEPNEANKKICLALAEKMCEKMLDDERIHEEIELYLLILHRQGKLDEEYKILTGPLCNRLPDHLSWFNRRRAYLCFDLKMYSRAFKHYFPSLIAEYPDQLEYYQGLFKAALLIDTESHQAGSNQQQSQPATTASKPTMPALVESIEIVERQCSLALELNSTLDANQHQQQQKVPGARRQQSLSRASSLNSSSESKKSIRGPFIARIELLQTILANESQFPASFFQQCKDAFYNKYVSLEALLLDYFQSFGRKMIFHFDIEYILTKCGNYLDSQSLLDSIRDWISSLDATSSATNGGSNVDCLLPRLDKIFVHLNFAILQHSLSYDSYPYSVSRRYNVMQNFIQAYDNSLSLGKNTNLTEFIPSDYYCLLAINFFMTRAIAANDLADQTNLTDSQIFSLIVMANNAIANSPANHQIKLILIKLYNFIGAAKVSSQMLEKLEIKHFQIDTLGHLLNPVLYYCGHFALSQSSLSTCLKFYSVGLKDCLDGLGSSYKDRRFSKIEEVARVKDRLEYSLNHLQCLYLSSIVENVNVSSADELQDFCQTWKTNYASQLGKVFEDRQDDQQGGDSIGSSHIGSSTAAKIISDNRDFKVLKSFCKKVDQQVETAKRDSFIDETLWMQMRYNVVKCVTLCHSDYANQQQRSGSKNDLSCLKDSLERLRKYCATIIEQSKHKKAAQTAAGADNNYSFLQPEQTPLSWLPADELRVYLELLVTPIEYCTLGCFSQSLHDKYLSNLETIVASIEVRIAALTHGGEGLVRLKEAIGASVLALETISLAMTSLLSLTTQQQNQQTQTSATATISVGTESGKSKLRASKLQLLSKTEAACVRLSSSIRTIDYKRIVNNRCKLDANLLSAADAKPVKSNLGHTLTPLVELESSEICAKNVRDKLIESFAESTRQIDDICKRKIKLLRVKDLAS